MSMEKSRKPSLKISMGACLLLVCLVIGIIKGDGSLMEFLIMFLTSAIHESGHIIAARLCKIELGSIRLDILGARINTTAIISYEQEWILCAGGPLFNLLSAAMTLVFASVFGWDNISYLFVLSSLCLASLNLLPMDSFDGGRMLYCMTAAYLGECFATQLVRILTFSFILIMWLLSVYLLLRVSNMLSLFVFSACLFCRMIRED